MPEVDKIKPLLNSVQNDFVATVNANPSLTDQELIKKFPELNEFAKLGVPVTQSISYLRQYHADTKSGKYQDIGALKNDYSADKFVSNQTPVQKSPTTQPKADPIDAVQNDFVATLNANPSLTDAQLLEKFPEIRTGWPNPQEGIDYLRSYYADAISGKYQDLQTLKSEYDLKKKASPELQAPVIEQGTTSENVQATSLQPSEAESLQSPLAGSTSGSEGIVSELPSQGINNPFAGVQKIAPVAPESIQSTSTTPDYSKLYASLSDADKKAARTDFDAFVTEQKLNPTLNADPGPLILNTENDLPLGATPEIFLSKNGFVKQPEINALSEAEFDKKLMATTGLPLDAIQQKKGEWALKSKILGQGEDAGMNPTELQIRDRYADQELRKQSESLRSQNYDSLVAKYGEQKAAEIWNSQSEKIGLDYLTSNDLQIHKYQQQIAELESKEKRTIDEEIELKKYKSALEVALDTKLGGKDLFDKDGNFLLNKKVTPINQENFVDTVNKYAAIYDGTDKAALTKERDNAFFQYVQAKRMYDESLAKYEKTKGTYKAPTSAGETGFEHADEAQIEMMKTQQFMEDRLAYFMGINRALLLNQDPGKGNNDGFWTGLADNFKEAINIESNSQSALSDHAIRGIQAAGFETTPEQDEKISSGFMEQLGGAIGSSIPVMVEIGLQIGLMNKAAGVLQIPKLAQAIAGGNKTKEFLVNLTYDAITQSFAFQGAGESGFAGAGEGIGQSIGTAILGRFGVKNKLANIGIRLATGSTTEVLSEYAGEFVDELQKNDLDLKKALDNTFGTGDEASNKLKLTWATALILGVPGAVMGSGNGDQNSFLFSTEAMKEVQKSDSKDPAIVYAQENDFTIPPTKEEIAKKDEILEKKSAGETVTEEELNQATLTETREEFQKTKEVPADNAPVISKPSGQDTEYTFTESGETGFVSEKELITKLDDEKFVQSVSEGKVGLNVINPSPEVEAKIAEKFPVKTEVTQPGIQPELESKTQPVSEPVSTTVSEPEAAKTESAPEVKTDPTEEFTTPKLNTIATFNGLTETRKDDESIPTQKDPRMEGRNSYSNGVKTEDGVTHVTLGIYDNGGRNGVAKISFKNTTGKTDSEILAEINKIDTSLKNSDYVAAAEKVLTSLAPVKTELVSEVKTEPTPTVKPEQLTLSEGSKTSLPPRISGGMAQKMEYVNGEWKQEVGGKLIDVSETQQEEAQKAFDKQSKVEVNEAKTETKTETGVLDTEKVEKEKQIKEKFKAAADKIRSAKISLTDLNSLSTNIPGALIEAAVNSSIAAAALTVEAAGTVAQAVTNGIIALKKTDWYKGLSEENKKKAEQSVSSKLKAIMPTDLEESKLEPKYARNVSVLITPATVRSKDSKTEKIKGLSIKYDEVVRKITEFPSEELLRKKQELEAQILDAAKQEIVDKVDKINGVSVMFKDNNTGSWDGYFEPSFNMYLSIDENSDTKAVSDMLFDFAEDYSQDAFIVELNSELNDDFNSNKIPAPLVEDVNSDGFVHYLQFQYDFENNLTPENISEISNTIKKEADRVRNEFSKDNNPLLSNFEINFSINSNKIRFSIVPNFTKEQDAQFTNEEKLKFKKEHYEQSKESIQGAFADESGYRKGMESNVFVKKSRYFGAKNERSADQFREYDRSDVFEGVKQDIRDKQRKAVELKNLRDKEIELQKQGEQLSPEDKAKFDQLTKEVQPIVQETFETKQKLYAESKLEVETFAEKAIGKVKGFLSKFGLKRPPRASVKTMRWYGGFTDKLGDGARTNIVVSTEAEAKKVFDKLKEHPSHQVTGEKPRVEEGDGQGAALTDLGYPKKLIEITTSNGLIGEIQVMTVDGLVAKDGVSGFPKDKQAIAQEKLDEIREDLGFEIPDGLGHYFYELNRDYNVDDAIRDEAKRLSIQYYDAMINPVSSKIDAEQFKQDLAELRKKVDADPKTNWDKGNEGKFPKTGDEFLSQEKITPKKKDRIKDVKTQPKAAPGSNKTDSKNKAFAERLGTQTNLNQETKDKILKDSQNEVQNQKELLKQTTDAFNQIMKETDGNYEEVLKVADGNISAGHKELLYAHVMQYLANLEQSTDPVVSKAASNRLIELGRVIADRLNESGKQIAAMATVYKNFPMYEFYQKLAMIERMNSNTLDNTNNRTSEKVVTSESIKEEATRDIESIIKDIEDNFTELFDDARFEKIISKLQSKIDGKKRPRNLTDKKKQEIKNKKKAALDRFFGRKGNTYATIPGVQQAGAIIEYAAALIEEGFYRSKDIIADIKDVFNSNGANLTDKQISDALDGLKQFREILKNEEVTTRRDSFDEVMKLAIRQYLKEGLKISNMTMDQALVSSDANIKQIKQNVIESLKNSFNLTEQEAKSAIDAIDQVFREKAVQKLKKKFDKFYPAVSPKKAHQKKEVDKIADDVSLGALDTTFEFMNMAFQKYGLLDLNNPRVVNDIRSKAMKIANAPEGVLKNQRRKDLATYLHKLRGGYGFKDWLMSRFYADILSGPLTHLKNLKYNSVAIGLIAPLTQMYTTGANPISTWKEMRRSFLESDRKVAAHYIKTGDDFIDPNVGPKAYVDAVEFNLIKNGYSKLLNLASTRMLAASDMALTRPLSSAIYKNHVKAYLRTEKGLKGKELEKAASELMGYTEENVKTSSEQALQDIKDHYGFDPFTEDTTNSIKREAAVLLLLRTQERITENSGIEEKMGTDSWLDTWNGETLIESADKEAKNMALTGETLGTVGLLTSLLDKVTEKFPLLKFKVPFSRVIGNMLNLGIKWSPGVGALQAGSRYFINSKLSKKGMPTTSSSLLYLINRVAPDSVVDSKFMKSLNKEMSQRQAKRDFINAAVITAVQGLIYALMAKDDDDEGLVITGSLDPSFYIRGSITKGTGIVPWGVYYRNSNGEMSFLSEYKNSATGYALSFFGELSERRMQDDSTPAGMFVKSLYSSAFFSAEKPALTGLKEAFDFLTPTDKYGNVKILDEKGYSDAWSTWSGGLFNSVLTPNLFKQSNKIVEQVYGMDEKRATNWWQAMVKGLPFVNQDMLETQFDHFGRPIEAKVELGFLGVMGNAEKGYSMLEPNKVDPYYELFTDRGATPQWFTDTEIPIYTQNKAGNYTKNDEGQKTRISKYEGHVLNILIGQYKKELIDSEVEYDMNTGKETYGLDAWREMDDEEFTSKMRKLNSEARDAAYKYFFENYRQEESGVSNEEKNKKYLKVNN